MGADTLTALSITGTILRFINFGTTLLGRCYCIHTSPDGGDHIRFNAETLTSDLESLNERLSRTLRTATSCLTKDEQALENVRLLSSNVSVDLRIRLSRTSVAIQQAQDQIGLHESLKKLWVQRDLDTLGRRLSTIRLELETQILPYLK
jgi:hypothetical protein